MKIRCVKITSPTTGKNLGQKSPWLTVGKIYVVLALTVEFGKIRRVLVESDEASVPKDFYVDQFEVIDEDVPENWITKSVENGVVWKAPGSWLEEGFWERFDNGEEAALREYMRERDRMM